MNTIRFLSAALAGSLVACAQSQAALLGLNPDKTSPVYADFTANNLDVNYVYSGTSSTGTGTFTVSDPYSSGSLVNEVESYFSSSQSPGTLGAYHNTSFNGSYTISANIQNNNGVISLQGGTFTVRGDLIGGAGHSGDVLLQGSLKTGAGGTAFGYVDPGKPLTAGTYNEFDFLIDLSSLTGNAAIVADFLKNVGGTGDIILDANFDYGHKVGPQTLFSGNNGSTTTTAATTSSTYVGFNGNWNQSFSNPLGAGVSDSFVPEPSAYALAGAVMALLGLASVRRKASGAVFVPEHA
jgi:hypothetical protein